MSCDTREGRLNHQVLQFRSLQSIEYKFEPKQENLRGTYPLDNIVTADLESLITDEGYNQIFMAAYIEY